MNTEIGGKKIDSKIIIILDILGSVLLFLVSLLLRLLFIEASSMKWVFRGQQYPSLIVYPYE